MKLDWTDVDANISDSRDKTKMTSIFFLAEALQVLSMSLFPQEPKMMSVCVGPSKYGQGLLRHRRQVGPKVCLGGRKAKCALTFFSQVLLTQWHKRRWCLKQFSCNQCSGNKWQLDPQGRLAIYGSGQVHAPWPKSWIGA